MKSLFAGVVLVLFRLGVATHSVGCDNQPLISGPEHHVLDSQLSASSSLYVSGWNCIPARSRLTAKEPYPLQRCGSWYAGSHTRGQWIQVDFRKKMFVAAIATKGRNGPYFDWVTSYELKYSINGHDWTTYKEGAKTKTFKGNWDRYTISKHKLKNPVVAQFVRLYPMTWHKAMTLRWEIYGCPLLDMHCRPGFTHSFTHGTPTYSVTKPYQASCYRFVTAQKNWLEARRECLRRESDLVSVETSGEQHHLESIIRGNVTLQKPELMDFKQWGYWTSGTDSFKEGSWIWAATGRAISYKNWGNGEPTNNYYSHPENCLELYRRIGYKWNDFDCTNNFLSFICETKAL